MATRNTYFIPDNFIEDEKVLNGRFKKRNFIEACVLTVPLFFFFYFLQWATGIGWSILGYVAAFSIIGVFTFCIVGYNGDSWGETIMLAIRFRKNKYSISRYNPRIKTELTAEYLRNPMKNSRAEMLKNFIKNFNDALAGTKNSGEISDNLLSDKVIFYYEEDENIVAKPQSLKRPDELKADAKIAKKKQREKIRKQKEYLMTLGPRERKIKRAEFKAENLREREAFQREQKAKLDKYYAAVAAREIDEATKIKEQQDIESVQKQKELTKKQLARKKEKEHKKALKEQRRINTLREKEEARAEKERLKQEKKNDNGLVSLLKGLFGKKSEKKGVEGTQGQSPELEKKDNQKSMPVIDLNIDFSSAGKPNVVEEPKPAVMNGSEPEEGEKKDSVQEHQVISHNEAQVVTEEVSAMSELKEQQQKSAPKTPSVDMAKLINHGNAKAREQDAGSENTEVQSDKRKLFSAEESENAASQKIPMFGIWAKPFRGTVNSSGGFMTPYSLENTQKKGDENDEV